MGHPGRVWRTLAGRRPAETPVVICIDVEPDPRVFDRGNPPQWLGFERLLERLPELRRRLSEASGHPVAFTWFLRMDPQVASTWGSAGWLVERHEEAFARLTEEGDELALHVHTWRWEESSRRWIGEFANPAWEEHCTEMALDAFRAALGRDCRAHRGGDHFLSPAILARLQAAGVRVDLTIEPGATASQLVEDEQVHGVLPDYGRVPAVPYRSSPAEFPLPDPTDPAGPLLVPLLSGPGVWPPLRRRTVSLHALRTVFTPCLAAAMRRNPPVIALALRTSEALFRRWDITEENLTHLARHGGISFTTASAAADLLDRHRNQPV